MHPSPAHRAPSPGVNHVFSGVLALREAAASQEFPVLSGLQDHGPAADFADLICHYLRDFYLFALHIFFSLPEFLPKDIVKVGYYLRPLFFPLFDAVQVRLHLGGEFCIDYVRELPPKQITHCDPQGSGYKFLSFPLHIAPVYYGGYYRGIGGWAAYSVFLQGLYQSGLVVLRRGSGKLLFSVYLSYFQPGGLFHWRQCPLLCLFVVGALLVKGGEAVEKHVVT